MACRGEQLSHRRWLIFNDVAGEIACAGLKAGVLALNTFLDGRAAVMRKPHNLLQLVAN
jgi:hypothetical protein